MILNTYKKRKRHPSKHEKIWYTIPNVLTPDELVMRIRMNDIYTVDGEVPQRLELPVNGFRSSLISEYHNLELNMNRFKQIEFISGNVKAYILKQGGSGSSISNFYMGYHTVRQWVDQDLEIQTEIIIPKEDTYQRMWNQSAEIPGYGYRFLGNRYEPEIRNYKFSGSKDDWKTLKANPTGFQENLPLPGDLNERADFYPRNLKMLYLDFAEDYSTAGDRLQVFISHTLLVRFKGRRDL